MQAIETKYLPVSNTKPSRFKATCSAGSIIINYDYAFNYEYNHILAAKALIEKLGWSQNFATGTLKNGNFVHVLT